MISKIVALCFAILCIASTSFAKATITQHQGTQLRRIGSNKIYNVQGLSVNEEDRHRQLQDEEEEDKDVAELLEEVAELLEEDDDEESGMPTYSPTKPETEEPTSGMPTYSPTCEDDDCGKKDTPAPVAPAIVEDATEPPVPTPITTDPPVKVETKEPVPDELYGDGKDDTGGTDTEDLSKSQEDEEFYDYGNDVSGAETQGNENTSLSSGAMAGIIIGSLAVVGLAAGGIVMAKKKKQRNKNERSNVVSEGNLGSNRHIPPPPPPPPPMESDTDELLQDNTDYNQELTLERSRSVSWDAGPNPNEDSSFSRARTQKV